MGFSKGQAVNTIYGVGFIKEKRDNLYVVLLKNWKLAQVGLKKSASSLLPSCCRLL